MTNHRDPLDRFPRLPIELAKAATRSVEEFPSAVMAYARLLAATRRSQAMLDAAEVPAEERARLTAALADIDIRASAALAETAADHAELLDATGGIDCGRLPEAPHAGTFTEFPADDRPSAIFTAPAAPPPSEED